MLKDLFIKERKVVHFFSLTVYRIQQCNLTKFSSHIGVWYGGGASNTVDENSSIFSLVQTHYLLSARASGLMALLLFFKLFTVWLMFFKKLFVWLCNPAFELPYNNKLIDWLIDSSTLDFPLNIFIHSLSKGMQAVKLCSNNIIQFLTGVLANTGCPA